MAQQVISIGANDNDGTGDKLRSAMAKVNANFAELYTAKIVQKTISTAIGSSGDTKGTVAVDDNYFYYCTDDYDGTTNIWKRVSISSW